MRVGISFHGVCARFGAESVSDTSDGGRYRRPVLVDALLSAGHDVVFLQRCVGPPYPDVQYNLAYPELDLLFLEWRWPTYKNSGPHRKDDDLDRQGLLLAAYYGAVPAAAWDTDLRMTDDDLRRWPKLKVLCQTLEPAPGRIRFMAGTDWKPLLPVREPLPIYTYIGNDYDRSEEARRCYFGVSDALRRLGVQTTLVGNWLQRSPERGAPEWFINNTSASFVPRLDFSASMRLLNGSVCTTLLTRPKYAAAKLVTPRHLETVLAGCPALVPASAPLQFGVPVACPADIVDAVKRVKCMSLPDRASLVAEQAENLRRTGLFEVSDSVKLLESLCA
jgi:hypothetical protein